MHKIYMNTTHIWLDLKYINLEHCGSAVEHIIAGILEMCTADFFTNEIPHYSSLAWLIFVLMIILVTVL